MLFSFTFLQWVEFVMHICFSRESWVKTWFSIGTVLFVILFFCVCEICHDVSLHSENSFICFTFEHNNLLCNRWFPDVYCVNREFILCCYAANFFLFAGLVNMFCHIGEDWYLFFSVGWNGVHMIKLIVSDWKKVLFLCHFHQYNLSHVFNIQKFFWKGKDWPPCGGIAPVTLSVQY